MFDAHLPEGAIWRVPIANWQEYRDHLVRLSPAARRNRFGGAVADGFVARHAERALAGGAEIYGWYLDGVLRGAVELCPLDPPSGSKAEAAFSVEDGFQARGVGSALFARLLRVARLRGLRKILVVCLPTNTRMQAIAAKFGGSIAWQDGDVIALVDTPATTPLSYWREAAEDAHGFLRLMLDRARPRIVPAK